MKFLRTGLLVFILLLVALVAGGLYFAGDPLFASALRAYGPAAAGQPLDFQDARLSVFGGTAGIDGLLIGSREDPVIEAASINLDASTLDLLAGRLHLEQATLDGAVLHLVVDVNGKLSLDPGPPPEEVVKGKPPRQRKGRKQTEPKDRDFIQIVQEYWERLQEYEDYYDQAASVFGGEESPEMKAARVARTRAKHPGRASFLGGEEEAGMSFWLGHASLNDFRWETLDKRSGRPVLPPLKSLSLSLDRLGAAPKDETGPTSFAGKGEFAAGGKIDFALDLSRGADLSSLKFTATDLPVAAIVHLVSESLPYRLESGLLDLDTRKLRFADDQLQGKVKLNLRQVVLEPKPGAPEVLGMKPQEFCKLLNQALATAPVALDFVLGGTPTEPSFKIENESSLKDILTGAVKAEAEARGKELLEQKKDELLGGKDPKDVLGGLLGGDGDKKKGGKKKGGKKDGAGGG
ncbi:MAG: DUF748 domain-containing protein [Planctomycetes bacterium]|nr:DUF748 domain-containing protein [Planctomycetota bacterium]